MKYLILLALCVPALAGGPGPGGSFATVTFTGPAGETWIDSGIVRRVFEQPSPVKGYSLMSIEFTDHTDQYHLDEGTVAIEWR